MSMQRAIRLRLRPTAEQAAVLLETLRQHAACFNAVTRYGWEHRTKNGIELHHATYYPLRLEHDKLPAQLVCAARVRATEAVKSALARKKQGRPAKCPIGKLPPIRYDARSYTFRLAEGVASLASVAGRQGVTFGRYNYAEQIFARAVGFDSADLTYKQGKFWLWVVVTLPEPVVEPTGQVVGVDLGLNRPAVTSNARFLGARRWRGIDRRYFRLKRSLQAKGTQSAKRHLKRLRRKVQRFRRDCDHVLSKRVVQAVEPGTVLAVENLTHIRKRVKQRGRESRRRLHSWSFAQFRAFLTYKAADKGCPVEGVDPRHTSQACSRCGHIARANRKSQSRFVCKACGFELNADLNAARNIAAKYLTHGGKPVVGGLVVNQPIVSVHEFAPGSGTSSLHTALAVGGSN